MRAFLSYSGGVESTTLLAMFGHAATPIFADTGWEHAAMYARLEEVERLTGRPIVRVRREGLDLPGEMARRKFFPGPRQRYCTRMFKIEPIDAFLAQHAPCELMIGLNAAEGGLRVGNLSCVEGVTFTYPLVDLGITRAMCVAFLRERGLLPRFPEYMRRGGCKGCFFKSRREYWHLARESPAEADELADLEDVVQDERGARYGIRDGIKSLRHFNESARRQMALPIVHEPDDDDPEPSPCGLFCHR